MTYKGMPSAARQSVNTDYDPETWTTLDDPQVALSVCRGAGHEYETRNATTQDAAPEYYLQFTIPKSHSCGATTSMSSG